MGKFNLNGKEKLLPSTNEPGTDIIGSVKIVKEILPAISIQSSEATWASVARVRPQQKVDPAAKAMTQPAATAPKIRRFEGESRKMTVNRPQ